ncbi:MAG TPA: glutaminyl-peptide cyclotransferase [Rhizomicrobium sp.]|nr:glutaminyl-peptide cyclotransferase [Rhizomicrobium sp.]
MRAPLYVLLALLLTAPAAAQVCPVPKILAFVTDREIRRSAYGFTEGLEVAEGALLESTGDLMGNTVINRIDLASGEVRVLMDAGTRYFGEGLTRFGGRLYQMSWREHRVFVFDHRMKPLGKLKNPREGWGLTHDQTRLIASDGSGRLYFLSPEDFSTLGSLAVTDQGRSVSNLNELEFVDGAVWANVFQTWTVVKISPVTGCVLARADLSPLHARMTPADRHIVDSDANFVPNGIAWDPESRRFILTGKEWPMLFSGQFVEE